jgi:asparaginyl-tRNA synthetase
MSSSSSSSVGSAAASEARILHHFPQELMTKEVIMHAIACGVPPEEPYTAPSYRDDEYNVVYDALADTAGIPKKLITKEFVDRIMECPSEPTLAVASTTAAAAAAAADAVDATQDVKHEDQKSASGVATSPSPLSTPSSPSPVIFRLDHVPIKRIHEMYSVEKMGKEWGKVMTVCGHVQRKERIFVTIVDGSCATPLHLVLTKELSKSTLHPATTIRAKGTFVQSPAKSTHPYEIQVQELHIMGPVRDPATFLPTVSANSKHATSIETWRKRCTERGHDPRLGAIFRIRSKLHKCTSDFMYQYGVMKLDPNVLTSSDCEGAGEMFVVTMLMDENTKLKDLPVTDRSKDGKEPAIDWSKDHFARTDPVRLTVSSQLGLEYLAASMGPVFTTNPSFRGEKSRTQRHLAEFTHVEAELPFITFDQLMDFEEEYVQYCFRRVLAECRDDLLVLEKFKIAPGVVKKLETFVSSPFKRVTYTEAIEVLTKHQQQVIEKFPETKGDKFPKWGDDLGGECERWLAEYHYKCPVFVRDMPKKLKAFYMRAQSLLSGKETVQGCDLLVPGLGELIGGSMRESDYEILGHEMLKRGMYRVKVGGSGGSDGKDDSKDATDKEVTAALPDEKLKEKVRKTQDSTQLSVDAIMKMYDLDFGPLQDYVELRKNASTPTGGFGLGFDRLVTICTSGEDGGNVRDRVPFPVAWKECKY